MKKCTKAVIMLAGWGTRMLPITKSIEKSMLPVGLRPVIDYIVQDVVQAGITDIYFVVGEQSTQLQSYYGRNIALESYLTGRGQTDKLPLIAPPQDVTMHFIAQPANSKYGTSVPVGLVADRIPDDEQALCLYGDQFFYRQDGGSNAADLIQLVRDRGTTAGLFGNQIPESEVEKYGIIETDDNDNFVRIVEKPARDKAPSTLNNSGFFLFDHDLFELTRTLPPNPTRGEYEITDAINAYVASGKQITVGVLKGEYMECGSLTGWHRANQVIVGNQ